MADAALPPAGHLRDELAGALPSSVGPAGLRTRDEVMGLGEPFAVTQLGDMVLDALLPVVVRALTEARAEGWDKGQQATHDHWVSVMDGPWTPAPNNPHLRASIRQTDERNDR